MVSVGGHTGWVLFPGVCLGLHGPGTVLEPFWDRSGTVLRLFWNRARLAGIAKQVLCVRASKLRATRMCFELEFD